MLAVVLLCFAFFLGLSLTLLYKRFTAPTQIPITQEFALAGAAVVPSDTVTAVILGSISISGDIPTGSTINVEAKRTGAQQFSTVLQNLSAKSTQTFSYTKATSATNYDMKASLLDPAGKVIGESKILTVSAPSLNVQFSIKVPSVTPTATPKLTLPALQTNPAPSPTPSTATPTNTPTPILSNISGNISFHGAAPINSRIVVLQKLANASSYLVAIDNLVPIDGTIWQWNNSTIGNAYSLIAVLKQKQTDGSDIDFATSAPVTVTAPAANIVLTLNSSYTPPKPAGISTVNCTTYNSGPNQNTWNVAVNFPTFSGAQSYWLEIGTTDGAFDLSNTFGNTITVSTVFKNNTTYYARYAYAAVLAVDTGSGQYSTFSDSTRLICSK